MSVLKWAKVQEMDVNEIHMKLLIYGDSGTGKTWCASTAPNPVYLLTEPNGLPTIRAANPDAIVIQADEANGGMATVREFLKAAKDGSLQRETGAKTVVLDSMNELQRMIRDEIMATKRGTPQEGSFSISDWGTLTDKMRGLVRSFRDLPFHVIGITHADAQMDESTSTRYVQPSFQGKALPNEIAGYFSAVGLMYRERQKDENGEMTTSHKVLLKGPPSVLCKGLPGLDSVEKPDITDWLKRMAEYDSQTSQPQKEAADPTQPKRRTRRGR